MGDRAPRRARDGCAAEPALPRLDPQRRRLELLAVQGRRWGKWCDQKDMMLLLFKVLVVVLSSGSFLCGGPISYLKTSSRRETGGDGRATAEKPVFHASTRLPG